MAPNPANTAAASSAMTRLVAVIVPSLSTARPPTSTALDQLLDRAQQIGRRLADPAKQLDHLGRTHGGDVEAGLLGLGAELTIRVDSDERALQRLGSLPGNAGRRRERA